MSFQKLRPTRPVDAVRHEITLRLGRAATLTFRGASVPKFLRPGDGASVDLGIGEHDGLLRVTRGADFRVRTTPRGDAIMLAFVCPWGREQTPPEPMTIFYEGDDFVVLERARPPETSAPSPEAKPATPAPKPAPSAATAAPNGSADVAVANRSAIERWAAARGLPTHPLDIGAVNQKRRTLGLAPFVLAKGRR